MLVRGVVVTDGMDIQAVGSGLVDCGAPVSAGEQTNIYLDFSLFEAHIQPAAKKTNPIKAGNKLIPAAPLKLIITEMTYASAAIMNQIPPRGDAFSTKGWLGLG